MGLLRNSEVLFTSNCSQPDLSYGRRQERQARNLPLPGVLKKSKRKEKEIYLILLPKIKRI
jgi:hypothetical protein